MNNLCWIRRDLRLHDHHALAQALKAGPTIVAFIFDTHILEKLKNKADRRITFIIQSLKELEQVLHKHDSSLIIRFGKPEEEIPRLAQEFKVKAVFTNRDYEPYAKRRDELVAKKLQFLQIEFNTFKDSVFFEKHEVLKGDGSIYKVFTPYKNKWLEKLSASDESVPSYSCQLKNLLPLKNPKSVLEHDWFKEIGFNKNAPELTGGTTWARKKLKVFEKKLSLYKDHRDYPAIDGTSHLSVYIRFGNISIREMLNLALSSKSHGAQTWLSELIWREFYQMILDTHPYIEKESFKREYDQIKWLGSQELFKAWNEGQTGFPIIDAAMRCFNQTGMMHNRLRMVVASFLCKTLLVNWRLGEEYFAHHLLDFDLAANNGGWQWCSSSGCDAQPYFRIFNPYNQSEKFDPEGVFIKQWVPELKHLNGKDIHHPNLLLAPGYPHPIVSYEESRVRCGQMYSVVKKS